MAVIWQEDVAVILVTVCSCWSRPLDFGLSWYDTHAVSQKGVVSKEYGALLPSFLSLKLSCYVQVQQALQVLPVWRP
jgi:hypothetical protein